MEKITIRAFRAVDEPELCRIYAEEHARVLTDIGVDQVVKPDNTWSRQEGVFVFAAFHAELGMIGAIRLDYASVGAPLRMEESVAPFAPEISRLLEALQPHGNFELCGLWNAHRFAGRGVPKLLIEAATAASSLIQARTIVTFIAEYVAPYANVCGYTPMLSIGDKGKLTYPVPSIRTHALVLGDALTLSNACSSERQRMISLRLRPKQSRIESPRGKAIEVDYDLRGIAQHHGAFLEILQVRERYAA